MTIKNLAQLKASIYT